MRAPWSTWLAPRACNFEISNHAREAMNPLRRQPSSSNPVDKQRVGSKVRTGINQDAPVPRKQQSAAEMVARNPDSLLEGFVDKLCRYVGVIKEVPIEADMSNRTYLLDKLDDARRKGLLPWKVTAENNIIVGLSAYSIKFSKAAQEPVLILRIPIHEIASLSYVNDDQEHLLFLKAGDAQKPHCKCHVICCRNTADAEDVCTILRQALQLVYSKPPLQSSTATAAVAGQRRQTNRKKVPTLQSPDESAEVMPKSSSSASEDESSSSNDYHEEQLPNKLVQEAKRTSRLSQVASPDEDSDDGLLEGDETSAEAVVQQYMERLNKHMGYQEIKKFASLLRQYREDNMHVSEFCGELQTLYGEDRKFLLPGMKSFIPEEDTHEFNEFLTSQGLEGIITAGQQDVDQMLASIDQEMGNVEQNFEHIDS